MKKIILSILLIVYAIFSMTFMDDRDDVWTGIGLVFYLPCWLIIGLYYLRLIWRKNKVSGADMLSLPLLQKIGIFKSYDDSEQDRKVLAKTMVPFLLSFIICPMLVSIIAKDYYFDDYENSKYLSLILLIVPVVLIISLVLGAKQDWLNKSKQN